jgi:hypothetical protein
MNALTNTLPATTAPILHLPNVHQHQHQHHHGSCCDGDNVVRQGLVGPAEASYIKGDLTGDVCMAIDLFNDNSKGISSAVWFVIVANI